MYYLLLIILSFILYISGFKGTSSYSLFLSSSGSGSGGNSDSDSSRRIYKTPAKFKVLASFSLRPSLRCLGPTARIFFLSLRST